ncbi:MAG: DUF2703 domain-containing protein [Chloroflexi bacterium]|nr:DUF2703 domain-containing protein [Chloroflexota bacterium]
MSTCTLQPPTTPTETHRRVVVELLYIDLTTCSRCLGTDAQLEAALALVRPVLEATGIEVELSKILVQSEAQARALRFASSPTIRIDGRDIALELVESSCGSCSEIAGQTTDCREWVYHGQRLTEAPIGMIVEALLGALYGREPVPAKHYTDVPENLKRFFAAALPCCSSAEQDSCCAASEKAACCGTAEPGQCGCR